jgi:hypothetical protein
MIFRRIAAIPLKSSPLTIPLSIDGWLARYRSELLPGIYSIYGIFVLEKIFPIVVVSATIPPPFGKVLFYLNMPWIYDNKQYENNDEKLGMVG